jgi:hypothetical protein
VAEGFHQDQILHHSLEVVLHEVGLVPSSCT